MRTKECSGCGREKPLADFHRRRASPDGLNNRCTECVREYQRRRTDNKRRGKMVYTATDPLVFATLTSIHVRDYVERAIARFERRSGLEAPPQLSAILALAKQLVETAPVPISHDLTFRRTCTSCGSAFQTTNVKKCFCSTACYQSWWYQKRKRENPGLAHARYVQKRSSDPEYFIRQNELQRIARAKRRAMSAGQGADK